MWRLRRISHRKYYLKAVLYDTTYMKEERSELCILIHTLLTQFTTGGSSDAEIATPINGPAAPWSSAIATPVPDIKAHKTATQRFRTLPLKTIFIKI